MSVTFVAGETEVNMANDNATIVLGALELPPSLVGSLCPRAVPAVRRRIVRVLNSRTTTDGLRRRLLALDAVLRASQDREVAVSWS